MCFRVPILPRQGDCVAPVNERASCTPCTLHVPMIRLGFARASQGDGTKVCQKLKKEVCVGSRNRNASGSGVFRAQI